MKINNQQKQKAKEDIISTLLDYIKTISLKIKCSELPIKQQLEQMDVIVEVFHFLINYDENVMALKQYYKQKDKNR